MELLNDVNNKNDTIESIIYTNRDYFKKQIDGGSFFEFDVNDPEINFYGKQRINVLLAFICDNTNNVVIRGASTNLYSKPIEVYLIINSTYSMNKILEYKDYIEELSHHEAVHLIKFIQKLYQISINRNDTSHKNQEWYNKYLLQSQEIHANISQLNNELKHIKLKYPDITFSQSLNQSKLYKRYKSQIFTNNSKLKNKILSKLANYWNTL
jgi:hypothetical protein